MKSRLAVVLVLLLVATAALAILGSVSSDPLAPYRAADGSLHIPGSALTPQLQRLLFGGNDLQPFLNLTYFAPASSTYETATLVARSYLVPNPNVFVHPSHQPVSLAQGVGRLLQSWFPPMDWGAQLRGAASWLFGLLTWDARASVTVDSTTVTTVSNAGSCSTTQTAAAADNGILVMVSERGQNTLLSVAYGTTGLSLVANTAANGGTVVRTEIWAFQGTVPGGSQIMTATLSGSQKQSMTCATVLLQGVKSIGPFINGATNTGSGANATITLPGTVAAGDLAFAVLAIQNAPGGNQPTAVTGTGVTSLYGLATDLLGVQCTGSGSANGCAAGADILNPGTAVTWTTPAAVWVVSAVEVVATPTCGSVGGGNCYRIGTGGAWNNTALWSSSSGGAACGCTPLSTDFVIFNAVPTGTTTLAAATTVAGLDLTGYTGSLDTTTSNWALTVNGNLTVQGSLLPRGSTVLVTGNVVILGAATTIALSTSTWTVNGTWTNNSTSGSWTAGTGTVTIRDTVNGALTFGNLGVNEFNNLTLDSSVAAGVAYTMATNALRIGGTLTVQNTAAGASGPTILDTSGANLAITAGAFTVGTMGAANTEASAITVNGGVTVSTAASYIANTGGNWTVIGPWSDASTSVSWSFAANIAFRSTVNRTMAFGPQAGNEFAGSVTFDTTVTTAVTYLMSANPLDVGGTVTVQNSAGGATGAVTLDTSGGNLAVNAGGLIVSTLGAVNSRASTVTISGAVNVGAASAYITSAGGAWTVTGPWTNRTTSATWAFGATITFRSGVLQSMIFTGSNITGNEFGGAVTFDTTAPAGITYTMAAGTTGDSSLKVGGALMIRNTAAGATAATVLDTSTGNYSLTAASLTLGNPRGALRSEGSAITINGAVNISDASSYLVLGTAAWTVTGSWTNASTDSVDWSAGTGTVAFRSAAAQVMTFGNLGANELSNVLFDTSTPSGVTYTMATNGLRIAGTLTVQNTAATPTGNTNLTTGANLAVTAGGVVLGTRGTLTANGSTITVNGSWTSTAANHVWSGGASSVVFAATGTVTTAAADTFNNVTQGAGTTTLGSSITIAGATVVNGTLDASVSNFALTMQSTLSIGAAGVLNLEASTASTSGNVTIAAGGAVRFTGAATWTINGSWTDNNTTAPASWAVGTATVRIVDGGATTLTFWTSPASNEFYNLVLDSSIAAGFTYTQVNALQAAGTLTVRNSFVGATGAVILDASPTNYASSTGALALGALGAYNSRAAAVGVNGSVTIAATGYITSTAAGSWAVSGSWTNGTTSGAWSFAASITFRSNANQTMVFKASGTEFSGAVTFDTTNTAGATYTLSTYPLTLAGLLTVRNSTAVPTGNTVLDTSAANLGITAGSVALGTNGTLVAEGSTIDVGGNWTVTAANATFTAMTSTVVFTAAATVTMTQAFNNLTVTAGTTTLASSLTANATMTVSGGVLAKSTFTLTAGALVLSGGGLTSTSGNASVSGNVTISSAASYIAFGSETWTLGGSWTNVSTSGSWSVGTATVLFTSASGQTLSFMPGPANEFYNLTLNSGASTATFTMAANGLRVANLLTIQGGAGTTTLSTSASNLPIAAATLAVAAGGALAANGSTVTVTSMNTSAGSFTAGTSTIVVASSGGSINVTQTVNNLTVSPGISTSFTGSLTFAGTLTLTSSTPTFNGNVTSSGAATITFASSTLSIAGSWNTSSSTSFTATSSTVTFTGAAKTVTLAAGQSFATLSVSGTLSQLSQLTAASLTISAGSLAKGTNPLTVNGNLTLAGGALTSASGVTTVTGNVSISAAASYIAFGSEAWTVGGSWTNASTSASWSAGTGTVTFDSPGAQTMTFAGTNLTGAEFNAVVFDTPAVGGASYTMATRGLAVSGSVTIQNSSPGATGPTTLTTSASNLPISAGTIVVAANGAMTANGSTVTFGTFDSSAGTFNANTSTLVASVNGGTINAPQALNNLTVNVGVTLSALSSLTVNGTLAVNGVLATATFGLVVATLASLAGGITAVSGTKTFNGSVTINAAGYFGFGGASWTFAGSWTDNSTSASWSVGTGTVTFSSATGGTMAFAGANLSGNEFATVVFASSAATAQTFTMATRPLRAGTVQVNDVSSTTTLDTSASNLAITATTLTVGAGGGINARGSILTVTSMDTSAGTFTAGSSTVVVAGSAGSVNVPQTLANLTVNASISTTFASNVTWSGTLTLTSATPTFNGSLASSGAATATFGSATITIAGSWNTASATGFTATGSTVMFSGAAQTVTLGAGQSFATLVVTGTLTEAGPLTAGTLTIGSGSLTKGTNPLTVSGNLTLSGGALLSTSGSVVVSGNVVISSAASYIAFGSEAWTVSGSWTDASTSGSWSAGTATVTFNAAAAQTMTFAGSNLATNEFNAVVFNSGATAVTFTLAANGLTAGTVTVQGGTAVTTLASAGLAVTATSLTLAANGALVAGGSTITVTSMDTSAGTFTAGTSTIAVGNSGGTLNVPQTVYSLTVNPGLSTTLSSTLTFSGTLTLTAASVTFASDVTSSGGSAVAQLGSAILSVAGSWNTTSVASGNFAATSSNVTFSGTGKTLALSSGSSFEAVTVTGTLSLGSALTTTSLTISSGGLAKGTNPLTVNGGLTLSGGYLTSTSGIAAVTGNVNVASAASYIAFGSEAWSVGGSWTNASTSPSWSAGTGSMTFTSASAQTMTFAGTNLPGNEFASVVFNAGASATTFTLASRGLRVTGALTVGGGSAVTTLDTGVSSLPISATTLDVVATGALNANASTITVTSMDTSAGTFTAGTSTLVVAASGGSVNVPQMVDNLTVDSGVTTSFTGSLSWSGTLTLTGATVDFGASSLTSSGAATMTFASATITMSTGSWDTSSAATFTSTGSSVTFSGTGTLNSGASSALAGLTISGGTRSLLGPLTVNGLLTISGGVLAKGTSAVTANGGLSLSGGAMTSTSGDVAVSGNVAISSAASYIAFGSETWTVSGSWTNASTSASWSAGTATVIFDSAASQTMTFASLPGGAREFDNVTFDSGASPVTFTLATNALVWSGLLAIQGGSGTTTLATGGLGLAGGSLSIGNAGTLAAGTSTVSVAALGMTGGASGVLTITTGAWTVRGNWDTSGAGSTFSAGTSTVTFTGAAATADLAPGQAFYNVTVAGTVSLLSTLTASAALTIANGATLTKTGQSIVFNALTEVGSGVLVDGTVNVVNLGIANSDATNLTTVTVFTNWSLDWEFTWRDSSTVPTSTLTFTIGGNTSGNRFNVLKDSVLFTTGTVNASGQVVFTMLGSDPVVDVQVANPCGSTRYWVGGAGNWSQTTHWSSASGAVGGCSVPSAAMTVVFDANSGTGTVTLDQNAAITSLTTSGWTGTLALGTYNLTLSTDLSHAGGTITIGASSGTGLSVGGALTLSGSAVLDGSGGASVVTVVGNVSITSATAVVRMGSGTWTFEGAWSNASTAAGWAAGTGTVVFDSSVSQAMVFGSVAGSEFYNVTFSSTAASGTVVFTMGANPLRWSGTLTIADAAGSTTSLGTAGFALTGGALVIGNGGVLLAGASAVSVASVSMNAGTSGVLTVTTGSWTVRSNWDTSGAGSVFTKGTGIVTLSGVSSTVAILGAAYGFYNLTVVGSVTAASALDVSGTLAVTGTLTTAGNNVTGGANLVISGGGSLVATTSALSVSSVAMNDAAADTLSLTTGTLTVSGSWDTSGASAQLIAGTSTVTLTGASGTIALASGQSFATLIVSGAYALGSSLVTAALSIPSGGLAKGAFALTVNADLTLSGGYLTSVSGAVSIAGNVDISAASSYIAFGTEAWTVAGSWTNASTSASWSAGTATVTFGAATSQTMAFAGAHLAVPEFYAVVFDAGAATVTFTLSGNGLVVHSITVQGGAGTTTLDTSASNLSLTADSLTVAAGGALQSNASTITLRSMDTSAGAFTAGNSTVVVNASGGTIRIPQVLFNLTVGPGLATSFASNLAWSGALTLAGTTGTLSGNLTSVGAATLNLGSATLVIGGSWNTGAAAAFASTGSSVTFTGTGQTIILGSGQRFAAVTIAGGVALGSDLTAGTLTVGASATLTKTGFGITFNALTVTGTVADGSVDVTGLSVANSDTTALVTITAFTEWSAGSKYGWTHSSNETAQTITWTISGNSAGFVFRVTKDGSDFHNGTVDASGNVVFTMLGSDPAVEVVVSPPPVPPWWTSSFFLPLPPIAVLMVVAMFAQRRRWRPAKAFLVDERGQLVREFTLDPACEVTYDQALKAGALDAVDKDVRVAKFHARAVHGDMLSLIMLAVGPANIQEVEFARGILVNIQDKFEDRVKARVEEARTEEESLQAQTAQFDEERADLQTRARVFGDMVNAFTIARGKLDAESRAIQHRADDLADREQAVAEVRESLEEQAGRLEKLRGSLDETAAELAEQKKEIASTLASLDARESRIVPKEESLAKREASVTAKDQELLERDRSVSAAEEKVTADLEGYETKARDQQRLEEELSEERRSLDELSAHLDGLQTTLDARTADVEARETGVAASEREVEMKIAEIGPREEAVGTREAEQAAREAELDQKAKALEAEDQRLLEVATQLKTQEATLEARAQEFEEERKALDDLTREAVDERKALDAKASSLQEKEADIAKAVKGLDDLKANLGPREAALFGKESDLQVRERALADERRAFADQEELVAAKALEIQQQAEQLHEREAQIAEEKAVLREAKGAFESERHEQESRVASFDEEVTRRRAELADQERTLGEARMRLTKDQQDFETNLAEKSQWIASKEIELEAKEQSLADREAEIRAQAGENAKRLAELASREETIEIEGAKLDKERAEFETRKAELGAMGREVEARTAKLRDEEARKGEELRTWQATLESEQALLKEQKETFEKDMLELRESWAGRMIRVEQREEEFKDREAKVQADVEWIARNETELGKREKLASENMKTAAELKAEAERLRADLDQRTLEIESRERSLQEEAANQAVELERRTETLQASEMELAGRKAQSERELATQTEKLKAREAELVGREEAVDSRDADLAARETVLTTGQDAVRQQEDRVARDRVDLQMTQQRLEAGQLELAQAREKLEADSLRLRTETDAERQSLAAKEADLGSERERLERESTALQDKLGGKARELAAREKAIAAREDELRAEEQDVEARIREVESREGQLDARTAETTSRDTALAQGEQDLKTRRAAFDDKVAKFELEAANRQKEWKDLQTTLKSQEQQLAASTETRHAEIRKRMEDLEQREHSLNAVQTQVQMERTRLEAQAKAQATRQTDLDAAAARLNKRFADLKVQEDEGLQARQAFESEKSAWSARRGEELKQLEATRDAAGEQTQQAERLIEESQRRALVAAEAEKAAKRQATELAAAQEGLERRRVDAEKAEKALEAQTAQLHEASERLAGREVELASRGKDLDVLQARLTALEKKTADTGEQLKSRKEGLDHESERIAALAAQLDKRQAEDDARHAALEGKLGDAAKREQVLSTELQRADHLMEDLNRKEAELVTRERTYGAKESDLAGREAALARRDAEVLEGMHTLEKLKKEHEQRSREVDEHHRVATQARKEAETVSADAAKMKAQAEAMQAEVAKNMRFLQKKALDVLDREEKIRTRENRTDEEGKVLETRAQVLERKERALEAERDELAAKLEKIKQDNEKLKARVADAEKAGKSTIDMDEWKRDIENRVKIIQKKALDLLDREEKLRKKEEDLKALAAQLGVEVPK